MEQPSSARADNHLIPHLCFFFSDVPEQAYTIVQSIHCIHFTKYNASPPSQHAWTIKVGIALGARYLYRRSKKETTPKMSWAWQICPCIGDLVIIPPRGGFRLDDKYCGAVTL